MSRQELIDKLMWNDGGMGLGITSVATVFMLNSVTPKRKEDDWKSVVAISGPPEKYTDDELEKLVAFSDRRTARYDTIFNCRMGCNAICINKVADNRWMRKRMTWEIGPMFSDSLDAAVEIFEKD